MPPDVQLLACFQRKAEFLLSTQSRHYENAVLHIAFRAPRWPVKHPRSLSATYRRVRADGWTPERRVTFCVNLAASKNVTFAAASVGLSRKAAYALKKRDSDFAALWQSALSATRTMQAQGNAAEPRRTVKKPRREGNRSIHAKRLADTQRDLFFATLAKTPAHRIVAEANRRPLLPTTENSPTLIVSKSA